MRVLVFLLLSLGVHGLLFLLPPRIILPEPSAPFTGRVIFRPAPEVAAAPGESLPQERAEKKEVPPLQSSQEKTSEEPPGEKRSPSGKNPSPAKKELPKKAFSQNPEPRKKSSPAPTRGPAPENLPSQSFREGEQPLPKIPGGTSSQAPAKKESSLGGLPGNTGTPMPISPGLSSAPIPAPWDAAPLYAPDPVYPRTARKLRREGSVLLEITVASDGGVEDAALLEPCRWKELNRAARKGVLAWKFAPPGEPRTLRIPVVFSLEE